MDTSNKADASHSLNDPLDSGSSDDVLPDRESKLRNHDLESQGIKPVQRSRTYPFPFSPVTSNLDDISENLEDDDNDQDTSLDYIDDHPNGYPRLAALLNSHENFLICRRFGHLHNRVLLYRQDELRELEQHLSKAEAAAAKSDGCISLQSRARASDELNMLVEKIDEKLKEYHDIVQRTRAMASLRRATTRNYKNIDNWIYKTGPLVSAESEAFKKRRDLVALVDLQEDSWFDGAVHAVQSHLGEFGNDILRKLFISKKDGTRGEQSVHIYSKRRIGILSRLLNTLLAVVLLIAPVIVLFITRRKPAAIKIAIISVFTIAFSVALSLFTKAKRHEVFAATAAYSAVLVVFLGNL